MLATGKLEPVERDEMATDLATIEAGNGLKPDVVLNGVEAIAIGGRNLQTHVAKNAATAGDVWVFDPSSGVVFVGDLVTFPAPFLDTACGNGWKSALEQVDRVTPRRSGGRNREPGRTGPDHGDALGRARR